MNWMDAAMLIVLALSVWRGIQRGLIKSVVRLASIVLGFVVAFQYCQTFASYLEKHWQVGTYIDKYLMSIYMNNTLSNAPSAAFDNMQVLQSLSQNWLDLLKPEKMTEPLQYLNGFLHNGVLNVVSFVILFLGVSILGGFILGFLAKILSFGFLGFFDKIGGAFFGFTRGILFVMLLIVLVVYFHWIFMVVSGGENVSWFSKVLSNSQGVTYMLHGLDYFDISLPGNMKLFHTNI